MTKERNNKGQFIKGTIPYNKGKSMPQIQEKNHYKWKGGIGIYRIMLYRRGFEIKECIICGKKEQLVIHHIDNNRRNNNLQNLQVLCLKCHNTIHNAGIKTRFKKGHKVSKDIRIKIGKANYKHGKYAKVIIGNK